MFNPKQALEKIRKQKIELQKQTDLIKNSNDRPLFPQSISSSEIIKNSNTFSLNRNSQETQSSQKSESLQSRLTRLQSLVFSLNEKLSESKETITHLREQNSHLEDQVLKLTHQNSQLKTVSKHQQKSDNLQRQKNNILQRFSNQINSQTKKTFNTLSKEKNQIRKAQSKLIDDQVYSQEVQKAMQSIKIQPLQSILKRKQYNFRVLKNSSKQTLNKGEKALRQLANIHKQYGKLYEKPTLIINLTDADFQ